MPLNLFDFISFPDEIQRKKAIENYFDPQLLWINLHQYCKNNQISEKITVSGFDGFFETANKDFREKARRFNNSIFYLTIEVLRLVHYFNQWEQTIE